MLCSCKMYAVTKSTVVHVLPLAFDVNILHTRTVHNYTQLLMITILVRLDINVK